jgi:hypothetical protein
MVVSIMTVWVVQAVSDGTVFGVFASEPDDRDIARMRRPIGGLEVGEFEIDSPVEKPGGCGRTVA